jgi:hypothetical protein
MHIRHFAQLPKPYFAYPKVIQGSIFKKQNSKKVLPEAEYIVDSIQVDRDHLKTYKAVCGFQDNGNIPAIYLAVLSQSLQMHMMTKEDFPFAILGLVHIRNQVTQFRKIAEDEILTLSCKFGELKPHDKGVQFDFITTAKIGNDVVMEGLTTYLSRQKVTEQVSNKKIEDHQPNFNVQEQWNIPENIGRRYALVSGDFNLIHLHALTAKTFGFKQAIAHGMWSNAKALASLNLPEKYQSDVWFKLPMYLPSQVEFLTAEETDSTDILIRNAKSQKPHVVGTIKAI